MAKTKNIQLGIDLQIQNYNESIKALELIEAQGGSAGKAASKLKQEVVEARNALIALGSTATPQELKKFIKINGDLASKMGDVAHEAEQVQRAITATKKSYQEADDAAKEHKKTLESLKAQQEELEKDAKKKKSVRVAEKINSAENADYKARLEKRGVGKNAKDKNEAYLRALNSDAGGTGKDAEAAKKILEEVNKEQEDAKQKLQNIKTQIAETTKEYNQLKTAADEYKKTLTELEGKESSLKAIAEAAENATESINENNEALIKARDSAVKAGQSHIKLTKATDETSSSFGRAARSVFNYTILYQGLKKVLRESVRTIKEMDDAITGMTVVTNLSREEAWAQVESFKEIAKATSSTMTEIAGLTTEYLKQGRAMKEAKILAEETAKSAKIAGISTAEAVQYMTSAINGFNLAASDATRVSDVFANLAAASATDFEDLAIAVSKVSAQANLAGMSLEYTTALLAKGIETTQEAPESIGTALKTIVARMRELSSYGSVLEDGASVNKVERALASAGIELRDVNGEFRDLEEIFNELGPKWDYLNTMQQQAIAQAVAGTRQQSRFVAIMQDWGRTQELIAEANASQGASAAQYYEYANGIEAALTRMKTSWEGFVQELVDNKLIINGVNAITKIIEAINKIPKALKVTVGIYLGILMINKLRENHEIKMKAYRQMAMTDAEKERASQQKTLGVILEEKKLLEKKTEALEENLKLQQELEKEVKLQATQRENDAIQRLQLLEKEIAIRKKDGDETADLEKQRLETIKEIEQLRIDRAKERRALEKEIVEIESRKSTNKEWQTRQSKEKERDSKIKAADDEIIKLEEKKLNTKDEAEVTKIDAQIKDLKNKKEQAVKEFENYIKTGLSGYDEAIKSLDDQEKTLEKELKKEGLSEKDRETKQAELNTVKEKKKTLTDEQTLFRDKEFDSQDVDFGQINEDLDKEQKQRQGRININKSEKEINLDKDIDTQQAIIADDKSSDADKQAAQEKLNILLEERKKLLEELNAEDGKNVEFLIEKEQRLVKQLELEEQALNAKKGDVDKLEQELEGSDTPVKPEKSVEKLKGYGFSVDDPEKFKQETAVDGENSDIVGDSEIAGDIEAYQQYLELMEQRRLKEEELKLLKEEQAQIEQNISNIGNEIATVQSEAKNAATTEEIARQTELKALKEEQANLEAELQAAKQYTMTASEQALYNENEAAIKRLAIEQQILENKKRQLEISIATAKKEGKDTSKQEAALKKLNKTITKNKQAINKLDAKNKKLADGSFNVYQKMADLIGSKLGVNFKAVVDNVKTMVDFSKKLVTDFIELWKNLGLRIQGEKQVTDEKNKQNNADTVSNANQAVENVQKRVEAGTEKDITDEKKKQGNEQKKTLIAAIASLFTKKGEVKAEKDNTKEKKKGFWAAVKNAIANISSSAGQPYGVGLPFAIAGLAILAIAGVAGSGINLGGGGSQSKEQKVAAKQNANYEMKKTNASATKALTEYNEIRDKKVKTEEDEKRIEELESELQELDESFKGLRGDQLANEVATRIVANKAAINKNVQDSFDLVVKMKHDTIDESAVARQALADKMILSQEELIASNSQLAELEQTQVEAITNTASTMATELANSAAWDEIYDSKKEKKQSLEDDLEQFARASTEFAIAMETNTSDDISDQIAAFEKGMADLTDSLEDTSDEFREAALNTVKAQYKSISYLSEMQSEAGKEMIDAIKSIVDKTDGRLTTEKLLKFSDTVIGATTEQQNTLSQALDAYSEDKSFGKARGNFLGINTGKKGEEHIGATKQDRNLEELRNAFGLDENASIEDVQKEMGKYIKTNSDGTLKIDKNGNYAFKATGHGLSGNNKHLTEIYKNLTATVEALGPYADLSETAAASLKSFVDSVQNVKTTLANTLTAIDNQLLDNGTLLDENTKQNVKLTGNMGYAVMKAAREAADDIERLAAENIAKLEQEKANAASESDKNAIQDAINSAKEQAHKDATSILAEAENMIGYMGDSDWLNRSEALESKRDNVQDIYDALWEEKDLSVEQVQTLYNDIIPDLIKNNPQLSVQDLYKTFTEGGPLALSYINDYLEDFNKYAELSALDTLGHDQEKLEDSLNDLFSSGFTWEGFEIQYDADGIVDIEKTLSQLPQQAIEEYMSGGEYDWEDEFNTLTNDISTYYKNMAQYDASKTELEKEEKLTPEEIRRANLEARIAKLSENSLTHRIELIKLELELNKELSRELSKQLQSEKERWNKALEGFDLSKVEDRDANGIIDIDDILKIENGQVEIIESVYEGLDEQLKIHITNNLDGLKEIVEAHYDTVKKEIELEEEKFEEYLDIQETLIDAYKDRLEQEQEDLEETLDKRKELYQEYFDWLNDQESEDETENDIEILRQRVANLSSATDAASLKAYKDAVEELEELEKEQIQSEQEKIQEQILANLDKQSEMVEEYYSQQLEDNKAILQAINSLAASDEDALLDLLKSADDYNNLTDEQQLQKDKEYAQLLSGWGSTQSTSQAFYDWWAANPAAPYDQVLAKRKELLGYSEGGLVDYTGLAMVHGSSAKPEAFLNAEQTALFAKLGEILVHESSIGQFGRLSDISTNTTINNSLTIENFDITINADMKDDQDIYNTGQSLADVFFDRIQASGIPVNIKK